MKLRQNGTVSFSIKLGAPPASGKAEPGNDLFKLYFGACILVLVIMFGGRASPEI